VEHAKQNRRKDAVRELDKNILLDSRDLASIHESAHFWLGINRPDEAVIRYHPLFDAYEVFGSKMHGAVYRNYFDALNRLNRHHEVVEMAERFQERDYLRMNGGARLQLVRSLMQEEKWDMLEEWSTQAGIWTISVPGLRSIIF
jgi:hypothetical protein